MQIIANMRLPAADEDGDCVVIGRIPPLSCTVVEPVGRWFESYCSRRRHKHTLSSHSLNSSSSEESEGELSEDDEDDEALLKTLDPVDWKNQDHYAVLGLAKLRYKATDDQIKRAYKKKVLKHHPDKRKARGLQVKEGEDDYFTCITRAYEVLGIPSKRRSYDSVDPLFDDTVPGQTSENKESFYTIFRPAFERNARWSVKQKRSRVPDLGDETASFEEVNKFYSYWYDFESWREFSYLDEEEKEKGENRDERRWIEKQNKAARQQRKKDEMARIRKLVDNAYACDPRIAKFKEDEKARKQAQKDAKREAARLKSEEEERIRKEAEEEARKKKEAEDEEAKAQAAVAKKEKEAQKKVLKKERKTLRTKLKDYDYFADDEAERVNYMQEVEKLVELLAVMDLQSLNEDLMSGDAERAKTSFLTKVSDVNAKIEEEKQRLLEAGRKQSGSGGGSSSSKPIWSDEEIQLLIKGVNVFPAGTVQRWETISNFITQHIPESHRSAKEVLFKAKDLQKMDPNLKKNANEKAFDRFMHKNQAAESVTKAEGEGISERFDTVAEQQISETGSNPAPWSADEQKLLEQAMRSYPASTPERWEKIAASIPNRTKKDCMRRYKELVDMVRAKKAAVAAAAAKKK